MTWHRIGEFLELRIYEDGDIELQRVNQSQYLDDLPGTLITRVELEEVLRILEAKPPAPLPGLITFEVP